MALDALICNAGIMALPALEQVRGIEKQFAVNHLGHFILVNRLLEQVKAAPAGRVVVVGSRAYRSAPEGGIQFDNLSGERGYGPQSAYGQSKLANYLFTRELARRLRGSAGDRERAAPGRHHHQHHPQYARVAAARRPAPRLDVREDAWRRVPRPRATSRRRRRSTASAAISSRTAMP